MTRLAALPWALSCLVSLTQSPQVATAQKTGQWETIWGPVDTVVVGLAPDTGSTLLYATQLSSGDIYRYTGSWEKIGGPGAMFVADHSGHLYGLSPDKAGVYEFTGTPGQWSKVGGGAAAIYAGGDKLFAANPDSGDIYEYARSTGKWTRVGGPGAMFAVDRAGRLHGLASDRSAVYRYTGTPGSWARIGGPASMILAGGDRLFAVNPRSGDIYEYTGQSDRWKKAAGGGRMYDAGPNGHLFGISPEGDTVFLYAEGRARRTPVAGAAASIHAGIDKLYAIKPGTRELQVAATPIHLPKPYDTDPIPSLSPQYSALLPPALKAAGGYTTAPPNLDLSADYKIVSRATGRFVDANYVYAFQASPHGGDSQRWELRPLSGGFYAMKSKRHGRFLTVKDGSAEHGARIVVTDDNSTTTEAATWAVVPVGEDDYALVNRRSGKWLEATEAAAEDRTLQQSEWHGGRHQLWGFAIAGPERCMKIEFAVTSIQVLKASNFGPFGEPGAHAEWALTIKVNGGVGHTWRSEHVQDGTSTRPDWKWPLLIFDSDPFAFTISAWGKETDSSSADDQLPTASVTHDAGDNWGIGKVGQLVGKNDEFHYIVEYSLKCFR